MAFGPLLSSYRRRAVVVATRLKTCCRWVNDWGQCAELPLHLREIFFFLGRILNGNCVHSIGISFILLTLRQMERKGDKLDMATAAAADANVYGGHLTVGTWSGKSRLLRMRNVRAVGGNGKVRRAPSCLPTSETSRLARSNSSLSTFYVPLQLKQQQQQQQPQPQSDKKAQQPMVFFHNECDSDTSGCESGNNGYSSLPFLNLPPPSPYLK